MTERGLMRMERLISRHSLFRHTEHLCTASPIDLATPLLPEDSVSAIGSGGTKLAKDRPEVKKPTAHKKPIGEKKDVAETPATKKPTGATGLYMRFVLSLL
ncbi:Ff.00g065300.m01.CDS01 [Fusarium sp. VM40]|nr:Ff.00g065300.m01.CDS01 [Fusarium sp. VM40]